MRVVVDASVAVKWLIVEEDADIARELATSGEDLHAPRLMAPEVANALWRKARLGEIERGDAGALPANVPDMPVRWGAGESVPIPSIRHSPPAASNTSPAFTANPGSTRELAWTFRPYTPRVTYPASPRTRTVMVSARGSTIQYSGIAASA